jgi:hypothetical protein
MAMKTTIPAMSVKRVGNTIYITINDAGICRVSEFRDSGIENVVSLHGYPCIVLWGSHEGLLVSAGETLYFISGGEAKPVLRAKAGNWFWHAVEGDGRIFIHEYGGSPTGIYVTEDLESFRKVSTNVDIDPRSRHFHHLAFDDSRGGLNCDTRRRQRRQGCGLAGLRPHVEAPLQGSVAVRPSPC